MLLKKSCGEMEHVEEEVDGEIVEPYNLNYSDLIALSSSSPPKQEQGRLETITKTIMETLGPSGPGLLTVTGVPKASELRRGLLPLARKLALLNKDDRRKVLKEHSLGSDVSLKNPHRSVSSFALQLKYMQNPNSDKGGDRSEEKLNAVTGSLDEVLDTEFEKLGVTFKELGVCMMEVGLHLARICDKAIGGNELEQSILNSSMAKGRLIHYHSALDNLLLKEAQKREGLRKKLPKYPSANLCGSGNAEAIKMVEQTPVEDLNLASPANEVRSCKISLLDLWQEWHYDYGIFTVLTAPMFISSCTHQTVDAKHGLWKALEQDPPPGGHTHLQFFDSRKHKIIAVRSPPDSLIIQVGESADIISGGKLHSTLHSVSRPVNSKNLSRETFVVFLHPSWDKTFCVPEYYKESSTSNGQCSDMVSHSSSTLQHSEQLHKIYQKIQEIVPPLLSRLKDGMTFAEFSRETTMQYYGSSGMQSNR